MGDDRWKRLLEHLRHARQNPAFDAAERDYRMAVAAEVTGVMRLAADGGAWVEALVALLHGTLDNRRFDLTQRIPARWIAMHVPPESLACFASADEDPVRRFDAYVQAVGTRLEKLSQPLERWFNNDPDQHAVLALGSLFNFAAQPEDLPVLNPEGVNFLEQSLGEEWTFRRPLTELYEHHLAFVAALGERCDQAGIPLRDMLDTQSLVADRGRGCRLLDARPRARSARRGAARTSGCRTCPCARSTATRRPTCASGSSSIGW